CSACRSRPVTFDSRNQYSVNGSMIAVMTTATTCRNRIREMIESNLTNLAAFGHHVANAANGVDLDLRAVVRELSPQPVDVDLDRLGRHGAGEPEDLTLDQLLGNRAALAPHQQLEHRGLAV